jgi:valyl-tRNA synthetase
LWQELGGAGMLIVAPWPELSPQPDAAVRLADMKSVIDLISAIRAARSEMNVPPGVRIPLIGSMRGALSEQREQIERLARVEVQAKDIFAGHGIQVVVDGETFVLAIAGVVDLVLEKSRITKEISRAEGDLAKFEARLGNKGFREKAQREVVEELEQRVEGIRRHRDRLRAAHDRIAAE